MANNKNKFDSDEKRIVFKILMLAIAIGGAATTALFALGFALSSISISFPMLLLLGFGVGGGSIGLVMGLQINDSLKKSDVEDEEYDEEYEFEDEIEEDDLEETSKKGNHLRIVRGSGNRYGYKFDSQDRPKLEVVDTGQKQSNRKK